MELVRYIKSSIYAALLLVAITGCMQKELVKVDLDTYLKNQAQYKNKHVVITATLKDVTEHYDRYQGREVPIIRLQSVLLTTPGCTTSRLIDD